MQLHAHAYRPMLHQELAWELGQLPGSSYYNLTTPATRMGLESESQMRPGHRRGRTCGMDYLTLAFLLLLYLIGTMEATPYGKCSILLILHFFLC